MRIIEVRDSQIGRCKRKGSGFVKDEEGGVKGTGDVWCVQLLSGDILRNVTLRVYWLCGGKKEGGLLRSFADCCWLSIVTNNLHSES